MAARSETIGDYLVTWLNNPSPAWPLTGWTATRTWNPLAALPDLDAATPTVQVSMDKKSKSELITRATEQRDYGGYVLVRQKYSTSGNDVPTSWLDDLVELLEEIDERLVPDVTLTSQPSGYKVWVPECEIITLCDVFDLEHNRQFTGIIEVTIREVKPK